MSHFTVLVIGEDPEKQLQPYHEYECTGIEDEFVKFVPAEENLEEEYLEHKKDYDSLSEFAEEYYGYYENKNGVYGRKTNPNSKWDWYVLGGRWTGFFKSKNTNVGVVGETGVFGSPAKSGYIDQGSKAMIDFEGMRLEAKEKAIKKYNKIESLMGGKITQPKYLWEDILKDENLIDIDHKRAKYGSQPEIKKFNQNPIQDIVGFRGDIKEFDCTAEEYGQKAFYSAISTFAVIKDGKWYEKGEMGWWACVSNEKDQRSWDVEFSKLIDSVKDDTLFSVYDCHI